MDAPCFGTQDLTHTLHIEPLQLDVTPLFFTHSCKRMHDTNTTPARLAAPCTQSTQTRTLCLSYLPFVAFPLVSPRLLLSHGTGRRNGLFWGFPHPAFASKQHPVALHPSSPLCLCERGARRTASAGLDFRCFWRPSCSIITGAFGGLGCALRARGTASWEARRLTYKPHVCVWVDRNESKYTKACAIPML